VVDMTDGADVDVRLGPLELGLRHWCLLVAIVSPPQRGQALTRAAWFSVVGF
jgi:hypothetical protein